MSMMREVLDAIGMGATEEDIFAIGEGAIDIAIDLQDAGLVGCHDNLGEGYYMFTDDGRRLRERALTFRLPGNLP